MPQFNWQMPKSRCPTCGKEVSVRSVRDTGYCSRVCASQKRYQNKFIGGRSGPADRPR